jgi:hypothetical protein
MGLSGSVSAAASAMALLGVSLNSPDGLPALSQSRSFLEG